MRELLEPSSEPKRENLYTSPTVHEPGERKYWRRNRVWFVPLGCSMPFWFLCWIGMDYAWRWYGSDLKPGLWKAWLWNGIFFGSIGLALVVLAFVLRSWLKQPDTQAHWRRRQYLNWGAAVSYLATPICVVAALSLMIGFMEFQRRGPALAAASFAGSLVGGALMYCGMWLRKRAGPDEGEGIAKTPQDDWAGDGRHSRPFRM